MRTLSRAQATRVVHNTEARLRRAHAFGSLLWRIGPGRTAALALLTVLQALLPIALILATGALVDAIPDAVRAGVDAPAAARAWWALAAIGAAFIANGAAEAVSGYLARSLSLTYAIGVHDTVAAATGRSDGIAELEDPEVAAELAAVEEYERDGTIRRAVERVHGLVAARTQGIAAFALLLGFAWWAPLVLLLGWRLVNGQVQRWIEKGIALGHAQGGTGLRRARYFRSLAVEPQAAKEVRVFGLSDWVVGRYASAWFDAMGEVWRGRKASWPGVVATGCVLVLAYGIVLGALAWSAWSGAISLGAIVVFGQATLALDMLGPIGDPQWETGRVLQAAEKVRALDRRLSHRQDAAAPVRPQPARQEQESTLVSVEITDVRFGYPARDEPTLEGLDLTIPAGQAIAIVGANGAGKTTIIKLLCGLYEPDAGRVRIDGEDAITARDRVGVIFQDFVRYELPIRDNVALGCPPEKRERVDVGAALADAGGEELVATLSAGWDSVLARGYDNGVDLSGGQWQKVALARALAAVRGGAGLLILDEPTANLDVRAEAELFDRFLRLTEGVTTVLVSHRLSSVRHADRIVVLANGRIVEDGTHGQLMALDGHYARMYSLQAQRFAPGTDDEASGRPDGEVADA